MAEARPEEKRRTMNISNQILTSSPCVCCYCRPFVCEQIFVIENLRQSSAFFAVILVAKLAFRQLFLSKERYNVNKRMLRSSFADYERQPLYDL